MPNTIETLRAIRPIDTFMITGRGRVFTYKCPEEMTWEIGQEVIVYYDKDNTLSGLYKLRGIERFAIARTNPNLLKGEDVGFLLERIK